jgi:hypothetical protein
MMISLIGLPMTAALAGDNPPLPAGLEEADTPSLPDGLDEGDAPSLPDGIDDNSGPSIPEGLDDDAGPSLPEGLQETDPEESAATPDGEIDWANDLRAFGLRGFLDMRAGTRLQSDPHERDTSLGEIRLQLALGKEVGAFWFEVVADFIYDGVAEDHTLDLDRGQGWLDLRQASVSFSPAEFVDIKVGRQILTWGTGDMLFLNDLFPKDWVSFFIGRDTEYLKSPSDALKVSIFSDWLNADVIYTPRFNSDRTITGERISYWSPMLGRPAGRDDIIHAEHPDDSFSDDEIALRLYREIGSFEAALYGYDGFWKSPAGMDLKTGRATFPRLAVYGASVRGPLAGGIVNAEVSYYDSKDDRSGGDPFVDNSQFRTLVGFERDLPEVANDFTVGLQWYLESMLDYGAYRDASPPGTHLKDAHRHVLTLRVTKRLLSQNLDLSLFAYASPSDADGYVRLNANYAIDDQWSVFAGVNVFFGKDDTTFFGQFEKDTNAFLGARWSF